MTLAAQGRATGEFRRGSMGKQVRIRGGTAWSGGAPRLTRRQMLVTTLGAGGSALFALACGKDEPGQSTGQGAGATGQITPAPRASAAAGSAVRTGGRLTAIVSSDPTG